MEKLINHYIFIFLLKLTPENRRFFQGALMKIKILFLLIILLAFAAIPVQAQNGEPPLPASPANGIYVLDQLGWLTSDQEASINSIIQKLDRDGMAEIAVVTLNDCGADMRTFRKSLFDTWGIGHVDDNDGLLILVCWYGGDASRRSVEQLYGRGLNSILGSSGTDTIANAYFVPAFEAGKPGDGLVGMVKRYDALIREGVQSRKSANPFARFWASLNGDLQTLLIVLVCMPFILWINNLFSKGRRRDFGRDGSYRDSDGFGGGSSTRF
jgi:uncharacterized membrane protein YgcG